MNNVIPNGAPELIEIDDKVTFHSSSRGSWLFVLLSFLEKLWKGVAEKDNKN